MSYSVKEIFYSLQGEGLRLGRPSVFCRFSGCNMWSGREEDREASTCWFCDTDFVGSDGQGGGKFAGASELARKIRSFWPAHGAQKTTPYVVFTGGEPTLQLDDELLRAVKNEGFEVAVETNGTRVVPSGIDWITVSPKSLEELVQKNGDELKLLYPFFIHPSDVKDLDFRHFLLSPVQLASDEESLENMRAALSYCLENPQWQLTLQAHKHWNVR